MNGYQAGSGQAVFAEDVYLYDLNKPASAPLAFRCARGGEERPVLLEALGISPIPVCVGTFVGTFGSTDDDTFGVTLGSTEDNTLFPVSVVTFATVAVGTLLSTGRLVITVPIGILVGLIFPPSVSIIFFVTVTLQTSFFDNISLPLL